MATVTAKVWKLRKEFEGIPKLDDFELNEESLPPLRENEILIEACYLSVDPYVRSVPAKDGLPGEQVARILESRAAGFPKGALVLAHVGWRSKTVVDVTKPQGFNFKVEVIKEGPDLSPSHWLGALGMPGITAFLALEEYCNPSSGEVIVISAASGAVGSILGQLAKNKNLTVVGLAGSKDKCDHIKRLGFDVAINYKLDNISETIDKVAPNGVDIYFDSVGGPVANAVYAKLAPGGRVLVCGQLAHYSENAPAKNWTGDIIQKELKIHGFFIFTQKHIDRFSHVRKQLLPLLQKGVVKAKEHITEGFENMPLAFVQLFTGANLGKAIVKAAK